MNMIFETHSHYTSNHFKSNLNEILQSLPENGVCGVIDCATDYENALEVIALAEKHSFIYAAVGIHPQSLIEEDSSTLARFKGDFQAELLEIEKLLNHEKVVAIGECGLDYHWPVPKKEQNEMLILHLELAKKHNLPIILHDRQAHADMYDILKQHKPKGVLHCYSGSASDALWITQQGLYLGIGGVITFANSNKLQETVREIPLEHLVLETDCPYLAPVPHRGKQCNSAMIIHIAQKIAELKNIDVSEVLKATKANAHKIFLNELES